MVLNPFSGWVFAGFSWGFSVFSVSDGGNAVESENYGFLESLYISVVLPGLLCGSESTQWLDVAGFSWGSPSQKGQMLSKLKTIGFCDICTILGFSRGFSVVLSSLSGWVLQGSLADFGFQCATRGKCCRI